jgi:hypothetical protein
MRFGKSKDEDIDEDLESEETPAEQDEEPSQVPLMTGIGRPEGIDGDIDFSSMGEGSKVFNKGTLLIVAVMLVAAAALYGMRLSQNDSVKNDQAKKSEARIEEAIAVLKAPGAGNGKDKVEALMNDAQFIIAQLDVDPSKRQVPVEFTKKNPFYLFLDRPAEAGPAKVEPDAEAKRAAERMKRLESEVAKFKIQSILPNGRKPVAIIDNKIVQLGEAVGSFKIKEIQKLAVVLETDDGVEFTLSIENDPNKAEIKGVKGR